MLFSKSAFACAILAPGLLLLGGCSNSPSVRDTRGEASREAKTGTAFVRYINGMDAHAGTDLYFGDSKLFGPGTKEVTSYKEVPAKRADFSLRAPGAANVDPILKNSEGLNDGRHYTVIAYEDADAKPKLDVINDDESAPAAGKAKVRLIHAAPGMEAINVYHVGSKDKLASESRFSTASNWQEIDPVAGPLEIRTSDNKTRPVRIPNVKLEAGRLYTFIIEGGAKSHSPLHVVHIIDNPSKS